MAKTYSSADLIEIVHPVRDMPTGTAKSVFVQAGMLETFKAARKKLRSKRKKGR